MQTTSIFKLFAIVSFKQKRLHTKHDISNNDKIAKLLFLKNFLDLPQNWVKKII